MALSRYDVIDALRNRDHDASGVSHASFSLPPSSPQYVASFMQTNQQDHDDEGTESRTYEASRRSPRRNLPARPDVSMLRRRLGKKTIFDVRNDT